MVESVPRACDRAQEVLGHLQLGETSVWKMVLVCGEAYGPGHLVLTGTADTSSGVWPWRLLAVLKRRGAAVHLEEALPTWRLSGCSYHQHRPRLKPELRAPQLCYCQPAPLQLWRLFHLSLHPTPSPSFNPLPPLHPPSPASGWATPFTPCHFPRHGSSHHSSECFTVFV